MNLNIVIDSLMEQVRKITYHMIKHATFDKTYTGKIVSANGNKYRVMIKDKEHSTTSPLTFYIGENVKVTAIQNNFNDLYIHPKASVYNDGDNGISDQLNQLQQSINLVQQNVNQLNLDLRATSILSRLTYNTNYVTLECANKSGNQIHIAGFVSSKIDAGISMPAELAPKESFAVPCLNYDAISNKDYQCQIMAAVSSTGIMIAAASAPYTYTRFDIRFFI